MIRARKYCPRPRESQWGFFDAQLLDPSDFPISRISKRLAPCFGTSQRSLVNTHTPVCLCNTMQLYCDYCVSVDASHEHPQAHILYYLGMFDKDYISPTVLHIFQHERQWKIDIPRPLESTQANTWLNASSCCAQPQNYAVQRGGGHGGWWLMIEATIMGEHRV